MASATASILALMPLARQVAQGGASFSDTTALWLALGAVLGIAYTLATEKYLRAMQHRHLFVRLSMLFLSALCWLCAAAAVTVVSVRIYLQSEGLEGFERVLGVLIPAVVRADLVVDWARRVSWALLNFRAWVTAVVQTQRVLARSRALRDLRVSRDVRALAAAVEAGPDPAAAEHAMWAEDSSSLVRVKEIIKHFRKLARVSLFGSAAFVGAIPGAAVWVVYAVFSSLRAIRRRNALAALLYLGSVLFAPFAAVIVLIASALLVFGVVSLSVAGTLIQFGVYWSIRVVYYMVRTALSEQWAGFPLVSAKRAWAADVDGGKRRSAEAAVAMANVGCFFPTELEFALSPWDGSVSYEDDKICDRVDLKMGGASSKDAPIDKPKKLVSLPISGSSVTDVHIELPTVCGPMESETTTSSTSDCFSRMGAEHESMKRHYRLMQRLGLDVAVNSKRKRRLATYYALGMLVNMQVESGGKAWCLDKVPEMTDSEFLKRVEALDSFFAVEAGEAVEELTDRLKRLNKYRIIHSGSTDDLVTVQQWLRAVVLFLLETPVETPAAVGMLVRKSNTWVRLGNSQESPVVSAK